jgi:hypothetical protein
LISRNGGTLLQPNVSARRPQGARAHQGRRVAELNARLTEGFSDAGIGIVSRWLTSVQSKFPRGEDK